LTTFKRGSEYVICLIFGGAIYLLFRRRGQFDTGVFRLLVASLGITILSELAFTFYVHAYGFSNLVGHFLKIVSFYLIYRAIIEIGLENPYRLVFRDLKLNEEALREREEQWRSLTQNSPDHIMTLDREANIIFMNHTPLDLTVEEVLGTSIYEHFPEEYRQVMKNSFERVFETREPARYDVEYKAADGTIRTFASHVGPIIGSDGEVAALTVSARDVTDRRQAEEALEQSEARYRLLSENLDREVKKKVAELKQAENMAAIGRVASTVAHEVRNPLHNIKMGVDELQKEIGDDQDKIEILGEITYGVDILNNIIVELLDYSKPVSLHRTPAPLGAIINEPVKMLSHELDKIIVHTDLDEEDREIFVDPVKFGQVLKNLISNAADAMPDGGEIRICSDFTRVDETDLVRLSISDIGIGIDEENLERIFEPFFTTKASGTGLGLSICKKILDAHDGTLGVTSKINEGTSVEITLPLATFGL
jgi:PAS domain S-box-containing protein